MAETRRRPPARRRKRRKAARLDMRKVLLVILALLIIILGIAYAVLSAPLRSLKDGRIASGVYLGPIDVSNLTEAEAEAKVLSYIDEYEKGKISFKISQQEKDFSASELNIQWDDKETIQSAMNVGREGSIFDRYRVMKDLEKEKKVIPIKLSYSHSAIDKMFSELGSVYNEAAEEPSISRKDGKFVVTDGHEGIVLDEEKSRKAIEDYFNGDWLADKRVVELSAVIQQPKHSAEELSKVKDLLGTFSTVCGTGDRVINIANGASKINGTVVFPGEEFSANAPMEPYDAAHGYVLGGTYENGTVVQSYGGGICQVSSTLYNAALYAELEITERANHSMMVGYVEPSRDAAIAGSWKDLKFKNNTSAPIYIEGYTSGGYIVFNIFGQETRSPSHKVEYESETISSTDPPVQVREDPEQPLGYINQTDSGHAGIKAKLWKVVYENNVEVSRTEINNSDYASSPAVYVVGTDGATEDEISNIRAALEAGGLEAGATVAGGGEYVPPPSSEAENGSGSNGTNPSGAATGSSQAPGGSSAAVRTPSGAAAPQ
ncbi:MAG: VanW family protein [Lachnospiraceae bacterium]|nr:VanW family protein [Lachnospiraceae bacterium]